MYSNVTLYFVSLQSHTLNVFKCHIIHLQRKSIGVMHLHVYFWYVPLGNINGKMMVLYLLTSLLCNVFWTIIYLFLLAIVLSALLDFDLRLLIIAFISSNLSTRNSRTNRNTKQVRYWILRVSYLRQVCGFPLLLSLPPTKTMSVTHHWFDNKTTI